MPFDWSKITSLAYETLIELNLHEFPIPVKKIKCKNVRISSYQNYANKTGISIEKITLDHELEDAFVLKNLRPNLNLILYNNEKYNPRLKHTLWHEIGHIKCDHKKSGEKEEIEAHFFAAQVNAPNIIIKNIANRGYNINIDFLMECFDLSREAAEKKITYLKKYNFKYSNNNDDIVLMQFSKYINDKYPMKNQHFYDEDYDALEKEREKW